MADPADAQLRVLLAGILYRATMRAFAGALASRNLAPPSPEEKMALHQEVERRAWALPDAAARSVDGREVDDGVEGLPELEAEVARVVEAAVARRASG